MKKSFRYSLVALSFLSSPLWGDITVSSDTTTDCAINGNEYSGDSCNILDSNIEAKLNAGQDVNITSTSNIVISENISKTGGLDSNLTLKATGDIIANANTQITSTSNKLNTILWSDSDGNNDGMIYLKNSSLFQYF
jgi:hypothetical protein